MPGPGDITDCGEISRGSVGLVPNGLCGVLGDPRPGEGRNRQFHVGNLLSRGNHLVEAIT